MGAGSDKGEQGWQQLTIGKKDGQRSLDGINAL